MDAKTRKRVRQLHALCGSDNDAEATAARRKLIELLRRRGKTWNDLDAILAMDVPPAQQPPDPRDAGADPYAGTSITVGDLVRHVIARHVALEEHEYDALALWAIHTHVYRTVHVHAAALAVVAGERLRQDDGARYPVEPRRARASI